MLLRCLSVRPVTASALRAEHCVCCVPDPIALTVAVVCSREDKRSWSGGLASGVAVHSLLGADVY